MPNTRVSRHAIGIAEGIAAGGLATAIALVAAITAATLIYAWFLA